jgi:hypothetical protein
MHPWQLELNLASYDVHSAYGDAGIFTLPGQANLSLTRDAFLTIHMLASLAASISCASSINQVICYRLTCINLLIFTILSALDAASTPSRNCITEYSLSKTVSCMVKLSRHLQFTGLI